MIAGRKRLSHVPSSPSARYIENGFLKRVADTSANTLGHSFELNGLTLYRLLDGLTDALGRHLGLAVSDMGVAQRRARALVAEQAGSDRQTGRLVFDWCPRPDSNRDGPKANGF